MPEPTPEAWAQIRHAYEHTDQPLAHICAEHDITVPMLRYRMKKWDWTRRKPLIPPEGPPAVDVYSPPPVRAANGGEGSGVGGDDALPPTPLRLADARRSDPPHRHSASKTRVNALMAGGGIEPVAPPHSTPTSSEDGQEAASIVPRLQSAVARVLPAIESTIARLSAGPHHPREMEQAGRTLSSLTRTLRELNALLAEHNARPAGQCDCYDDMPEDIDEFRHALARRIRAFVESRTNPDGVVPGSALPRQK